uniref:Putative RNA-dependent RNA polymerase n=1 Tax=Fusarium sacchari mitovirus 1 TaxID=2716761 RepID=A0A6G9IVB6_9VIRU|nr:putative RNA-dependent RNA polymerase [Fusarium sacchari mitovirus 1]
MLRNYIKIIKRLCLIFYPNKHQNDDFIRMLYLYQHLIKHHNISGAIKYMKNMRLICTRYICGTPLLSNNFGIATVDGWPKKLLFLKSRIDSNHGLSYILTLLIFNRSLDLNKYEVKKKKKNLDYSSIIDEQKMNYTIPTGFIKSFVKKFNLKIKESDMEFTLKDVYLSVKGGPQGKASNTALNNFGNYNYQQLDNLFKLMSPSGVEFIVKSFNYWWNNYEKFPKSHDGLGKISIVKDPEGKFRLVAIVDYYSQLALKKLNDNCFKIIKNNFNNCDRTFTQDPHHNWEDNQHSFWSLDLTSATDRFPRLLQARLLSIMYKHEYAMNWERLLGNINFHVKDDHYIKYRVGQPMGTYSSWICFTLAHHLVVHYAAKLSNIDNFDQYIILGDDIVIKNDIVAKNYIKIINKLGVDISLTKTHVSKDTYEFAKRWIKNKSEITGLPSRGIILNYKNPFIVFTILYDFYKIKKNQYLSCYSLVGSVNALYKNLYLIKGKKKYFPVRRLNTYIQRIKTFGALLDVTFDYSNNQSIRNIFTRNITSSIYCIPDGEDSLLELKKILSTGLGKTLSSNVGKVSSWQTKIIESYDDKDRNNLVNYPTFVGLYNYINDIKTRTKKWSGSEEISEITKDLNVLNVDNIYSKERQKYDSLLTIGKSLEVGFSNINSTEEIMYGSATVESSLSPKGMQLWFSKSIQKDVMDNIIDGKWEEPKPQMSYTQMWESLALKDGNKT